MIKRISNLCILVSTMIFAAPAFADQKSQLCSGAGVASGGSCGTDLQASVQGIVDILLTVAGAIAVIIIIISGIRYITSTGDATRIQQSKDTLLYAVIGLVVVIAAYAIVHFVATNVK